MFLKRCFDLFFAIPGLIVLTPLFMAVAVLIKLDSPGPIFFRQTRVGRYGKLFSIYKFRTMVSNAESLGRQITIGNDSRITRIGATLRRYKVDELPQLINVIKGEMSLVGPRPEVSKYVAHYPDDIRKTVLMVPPGITDYAAIAYKDENEILGTAKNPDKAYIEEVLPVKLAYYLKYAQERSLWLDFKLIIWTILAICGFSLKEKPTSVAVRT